MANGAMPLPSSTVFRIVSSHLDEHCCVVADVGDAIFGAVGIRSAKQAQFIAPAYYMSMGFAVPASIGIATARARSATLRARRRRRISNDRAPKFRPPFGWASIRSFSF